MRTTTLCSCIVIAAVTLAAKPAAAQIGHLGQDISDHVVLRDGNFSGGRAQPACPATLSFTGRALFRVQPDGTRAVEPFTVPVGRRVVITDVEWTVSNLATGSALTPGSTVRTRLQIGSGTTFNVVFLSHTVDVAANAGNVAGAQQLTTGIVVSPGTAICPSAAQFDSNAVITARVVEIVLRGYLINAQ